MVKDISIYDKIYKYEITRKKIRNVIAKIDDNLIIKVSANTRVSEKEILDFLNKYSKWIIKNIDEKKNKNKFVLENLNFISDENIRILGKDLLLKIIENNTEKIHFDEKYFYIYTNDINNMIKIKEQFYKWYDSKCLSVFKDIILYTFPEFEKMGIQMPRIMVKRLKSFWGSYSKKTNTITLNSLLLMTNVRCIEYVIMHELIHTIHFNHGKNFHKIFEKFMTDYKERRKNLIKQGIL